jgi:hypothetical protein
VVGSTCPTILKLDTQGTVDSICFSSDEVECGVALSSAYCGGALSVLFGQKKPKLHESVSARRMGNDPFPA